MTGNECGCGRCPTIIIPGIGQSGIELIGADGKAGRRVWPPEIDDKKMLNALKVPAAKMLLFRRDCGFSDAAAGLVASVIEPLFRDESGRALSNVRAESYPAVSRCTPEQKKHIYKMVSLSDLGEIAGENHLYFFAYNFFGSASENAALLSDYIRRVKIETMHEKVNIVAVGIGGAGLFNAYLGAYGCEGIHRALYFTAAAKGSSVVADILAGNTDQGDLTSFFGVMGMSASDITPLTAAMPEGVPELCVKKSMDLIVNKLMTRSTMIWSAVPHESYALLREKLLCDPALSAIRDEADRLDAFAASFDDKIKEFTASGTEFFAVCGYGRRPLKLSKDGSTTSDGGIGTASASLGAKCAPLGEKLPEGGESEYISPDGTVDASASLLPDRVWYVKNQRHMDVCSNDIALEIACKILSDDSFSDVHSQAALPRFTVARDEKKIRELIAKARSIQETGAPADAEELLNCAVYDAEDFLDRTVFGEEDEQIIISRLEEAIDAAK